jgi:tRNA(Ser,Leu) C12 N-acetylase TAN1
MEEFRGFVISSRRYHENEAAKEMQYILEMILEYEDVEVEPVYNLTGLSIAHFQKDPVDTLEKIEEKMEEDPDLFEYVLKIVPINFKLNTEISEISELAAKFESKIGESDKWRILLRRRATDIAHDDFIDAAAKELDVGIVDLEEPEYFIRIEVMGDETYMSLSKEKELSVVKRRRELIEV